MGLSEDGVRYTPNIPKSTASLSYFHKSNNHYLPQKLMVNHGLIHAPVNIFSLFFLENDESIHVRTFAIWRAWRIGGSIAAAAASGSAGEPGQLSRGRSQAFGTLAKRGVPWVPWVPWGDGRNPPLGQHENIINDIYIYGNIWGSSNLKSSQ